MNTSCAALIHHYEVLLFICDVTLSFANCSSSENILKVFAKEMHIFKYSDICELISNILLIFSDS